MLSDEERSTLEAALAFIDSNYGDHTDDGSALHGLTTATTSSSSSDASDAPKTHDHTPKDAAKRARNCQAAARSNRKKRAELLQLRELVAALETRRDILVASRLQQQSGHSIAPLVSGSTSFSARRCSARAAVDSATREAQKLNESRTRNRRLHAALEQQRGIGAALVKLLQKRFDLKSVQDLLKETSVTTLVVASSVARPIIDRRSVFLDLHARLKAFTTEVHTVLAGAMRESVLAQSRTRVVHHAALGPGLEMASSTLVPCELDGRWVSLMGAYKEQNVVNRSRLDYHAETRPNVELGAVEKDYAMAFTDTTDSVRRVPVDGISVLEMFETTDWNLFIWSAVISIRGDGTHVRERGWTAMSRSSATGCCVLHMHREQYGVASHCPKTKFLVESLLKKARHDRANIENTMLEQFGSDAAWVTKQLK